MHKNARLSYSSIDTFNQCNRKWYFKYIMEMPDPSGSAALIGNHVHTALETLYGQENKSRGIPELKTIARDTWPSFRSEFEEEFPSEIKDANDDAELKALVWKAMEGVFFLEDPSKVDVISVEQEFNLEFRGLKLRGFIDRMERTAEGKVRLVDFKTGKVPQAKYLKPKLMQLFLYAWALKQDGIEADEAALMYTTHRQLIKLKIGEDELQHAEDFLNKAVDDLTEAFIDDDFKPRLGPLCAWCEQVSSCPEGESYFWGQANLGRVRKDAPAFALLGKGNETAVVLDNSYAPNPFEGL